LLKQFAISIAHAGLAEIVFCLTVTIALVTSPGWRRGYSAGLPNDRVLQKIAIATTRSQFVSRRRSESQFAPSLWQSVASAVSADLSWLR